MNIHEYQAKGLMAKFGVAVPRGIVAHTAEEAEEAAGQLGGAVWVVKAQIHAGGRGKAAGGQVAAAVKFVTALYKAFVELDASIVEINPLVVTGTAEVLALDAKMAFDDNALYRHAEIEALRDADEEDPAELEAARHGLNYIKLDGNIGCLVNGAGLAMATMDIIKLYGGDPANFLDVGSNASRERVTTAFKLILSDANVEGILA